MAKQGIISKITGDMAESTRAVHKINKENIAAIKADEKAFHSEATAPHPDMEDFKQAKGLKNKAKVVARSIKESVAEVSEDGKEFRDDIKSHEAYKTLLEEQRARRQDLLRGAATQETNDQEVGND